jgi:N-acetylglucosaminyldiphosphoundecaprenol N-acetyl-beta-D-mannosaminyltransferase
MVFVGMGAPKQEVFIEALAQALVQSKYSLPVMFMAVGGSFDIITGRLRRAPLFIRSIGFEWAWRLFQEPWRWRRQLALLKFIVLVWKENNRTV